MAPNPDSQKSELTADLDSHTKELSQTLGKAASTYATLSKKLSPTIQRAGVLCDVRAAVAVLTKAEAGLNTVFQYINKIIEGSVPILSLINAAFRWVTEVTPVVSCLAGLTQQSGDDKDRNSAFVFWTGASRDVYNQGLWNQKVALESTGNTCDRIGSWLIDIADKNVTFIFDLIQPLKDFITDILTAVEEAATVFGVFEAIGDACRAISKLATSLYDCVKAVIKNLMSVLVNDVEAETLLNNNSAYPNGKWPQMVAKG
jgi:phage-related protein